MKTKEIIDLKTNLLKVQIVSNNGYAKDKDFLVKNDINNLNKEMNIQADLNKIEFESSDEQY